MNRWNGEEVSHCYIWSTALSSHTPGLQHLAASLPSALVVIYITGPAFKWNLFSFCGKLGEGGKGDQMHVSKVKGRKSKLGAASQTHKGDLLSCAMSLCYETRLFTVSHYPLISHSQAPIILLPKINLIKFPDGLQRILKSWFLWAEKIKMKMKCMGSNVSMWREQIDVLFWCL